MSSPRSASVLATAKGGPPKATPNPSAGSAAAKPKVDKNAAKAAKAAKRAAAKGLPVGEAQSGSPAVSTAASGQAGQAGGKGQQQQQRAGGQQVAAGAQATKGNKSGPAGTAQLLEKSDAPSGPVAADPLQPFLHLDLPSSSSQLSHSSKASTANIHPSIIRLALQFAEFKVVGANARCIAMLEAFKDVRSPEAKMSPLFAHLTMLYHADYRELYSTGADQSHSSFANDASKSSDWPPNSCTTFVRIYGNGHSIPQI